MNNAIQQVSVVNLAFYLLLFIVPFMIFRSLKIKVGRQIVVSVTRMTLQLFMVGFYLKYLFNLDSPLVNICYLILMLIVANFSILKQSGLCVKRLGLPVFGGIFLTICTISLSFTIVMKATTLMSARYLIPITGMLMGNILRYNIISLSRFYGELKKRENEYIQMISLGATVSEATRPFFREALQAGVAPQIGGLATMGLVSLPGMMTGQILGGSLPMTAIKYQILILTAIFTAGAISAGLTVILSRRTAFDGYKRLDHRIYL